METAGLPVTTWNRSTPAGVTDPAHVRTLLELVERTSRATECDTVVISPQLMALLDAVGQFSPTSASTGIYEGKWDVWHGLAKPDEILLGRRTAPGPDHVIRVLNFV